MTDPNIQSPRTSPDRAVMAAPAATGFIGAIGRFFKAARKLQERERSRIREEIAQVPGMMTLLMRPRNGKKWTGTERAELRAHLRRVSHLGLYLTTAALPGTSLTLPLLAWWLDRRRCRRSDVPAKGKTA